MEDEIWDSISGAQANEANRMYLQSYNGFFFLNKSDLDRVTGYRFRVLIVSTQNRNRLEPVPGFQNGPGKPVPGLEPPVPNRFRNRNRVPDFFAHPYNKPKQPTKT